MKPRWSFNCEIVVEASSKEEAEKKVQDFLSGIDPDVISTDILQIDKIS